MSRSFDPVQLGSIEQFCKAAELLSFKAAAEKLGLTPAAVSRSVARLEGRLKVRLFVRTTRQIRLTDDGQLYFKQCRDALGQIEAAELALTGRHTEPHGRLRISVPTSYGHHRVLPALPAFMARHPHLRLDVHVCNRNVDFTQDDFDLAVRLGPLPDSGWVARTLETAALGVYASPTYLARRGRPETLNDLEHHECLTFVMPSTGRALAWSFDIPGVGSVDHKLSSRIAVEEDVLACATLARAGAGLVQTYDFIAAPAVADGTLVEVLEAYRGRSRPFVALYPPHRHLSAGVRLLVDFLSQAVQAWA